MLWQLYPMRTEFPQEKNERSTVYPKHAQAYTDVLTTQKWNQHLVLQHDQVRPPSLTKAEFDHENFHCSINFKDVAKNETVKVSLCGSQVLNGVQSCIRRLW
ncbi:hypothetical protein Y032_0009g713 [Ancylostoma ceylanicum]|uniref:Uncharacterized protein n=1 Tax=Ancylostoma ceylanicum TaxID=53326 RepID=A0A016VIG0_9BILA|nr:hypothetical protein Y032_0009g713 [Ancylostoma ceylanicum]